MREKGITLVALVITIIVLLILAGVTINLTLGEDGIIRRAQQAVGNYTNAAQKEQAELGKFDEELENILKGNNATPTMIQSGEMAEKTEKNNYTDGKDVATIPEGFTVSGIPEEQKVASGLVIYDIPVEEVEKVVWDETVKEKYNQYVWIPCTEDGANGSIKYDRYEFTAEGLINDRTKGEYSEERKCYDIYRAKNKSYYFYEEMPPEEIASIKKYGGYYIGRYEAGINNDKAQRTAKNINDTVEQLETAHGKAISQAKKYVYNYVTRDQSKGLAENLDSNHNGIITRLCSSYAWDTALKFIETKNSSYPTNSVGGNYNEATGGTGKLSRTGYDKTHPCNIYDMGGNVHEWTTEQSTGNEGPCVCRGGVYTFAANEFPASYTDFQGSPIDHAVNNIGFRVTMYIE